MLLRSACVPSGRSGRLVAVAEPAESRSPASAPALALGEHAQILAAKTDQHMRSVRRKAEGHRRHGPADGAHRWWVSDERHGDHHTPAPQLIRVRGRVRVRAEEPRS
ncbi:hypothetical protein [Streptomyces iakyrus]|uniref:hypothetical protein n=1 Tax=Streptomyces iakyrus TaxID=68219 RepID=UPI003D912A68